MAAKNWRENQSNSTVGQPKRSKKAPKTPVEPSEPLRLGPLVKGISLILTLVALFLIGTKVWEVLQPKRMTAVYLLGEEEDFEADVDASGMYACESTAYFGKDNKHLARHSNVDDANGDLGPDKNTLLFYRHCDLTIDVDERDNAQKNVMISRNGSGQSKYQLESWMTLQKLFEKICKGNSEKGINRVLILDIGEVDENVRRRGFSIVDEIEGLLQKMKDEGVAGVDRFWVLISVGDHQKPWFAPELGSSVFSYFVSRGLEGEAEHEGEEILLGDLTEYVEKSVDHWVRDYRDSSQNPCLLSVATTDKQDVSLVFYKGGENNSPKNAGGLNYHKTQLADLWEMFRQKKEAFSQMPHYLSMMESRLIRLEEVRYCSEAGSGRSEQIFRKLKSELEELGRAYPPEKEVSETIVSIEQQPVPVNLDRLSEFSAYLFPQPKAPVVSEQEVDSNPKVDAAAPAIAELPEPLKVLDRESRLRLVWTYLNSDLATQAPITETKFKDCLNFIESSAGETGTQFRDTPVPWSELQYLLLLRDNVDWLSEEAPEFSTQKSAVLNAIRCRKKSESLIRGSSISEKYRSGFERTWHLVRDEFIALELERRRAEDLLFANNIDAASKHLINLNDRYGKLIEKTQSLIQMQRLTQDSLHIIPHLRRFLVNEATQFQTSSDLEKSLRKLNSTQKTAHLLARQLQTEVSDYEAARKNLENLATDMELIRGQFKKNYFDRLGNESKSAADVVFHAMNLLASPIPEWYGGDYRENIRKNLDSWIAEQHNTFTDDGWEAKKALDPKSTLSNVDLQGIVEQIPMPKTDGVLQKLNLGSLSSFSGNFSKLNQGIDCDDQHFCPRQEAVKDFASLIEWQAKLESLDFEIRERYEIFSRLNQGLDVGRQLSVFDSILLAHDRFERAKSDCWGAGDVAKMGANQELPPFVLFGSIEYQETQRALDRLKGFESLDDKDRRAFQVDGLASEFEEDLAELNGNWKKLSESRLAWANGTQPAEFTDSLTFETKLDSEFLPSDVEELDSVNMSMKLGLNRKTIRPITQFKYRGASSVSTLGIESSELSPKCGFEQVVGFRGHQIKEQFTMTRESVVAPEIVSFETTHERLRLQAPSVKVENENEIQGDIVFILDCSNSMNDKVNVANEAGVTKSRFEIAKAALERTISDLAKTNRFRFSLYAFGHRSKFVVNKQDNLVLNGNGLFKVAGVAGIHPFDDCECLFSISRNREKVSTKEDVDKINASLRGLTAKGITPLFYSIKKAAEGEFPENEKTRKQYMVVLTDGENQQLEGKNQKHRSLPRPDAKETTADQAKSDLKNAELYIARISERGETTSGESRLLYQAGAKEILSIKDNDSGEIANAILDAIGRSRFTVARKGFSAGDPVDGFHDIPETVEELEAGNYVVQTSGVEKPDSFEVELHRGVSVVLKNTLQGLVLAEGSPPLFTKNPPPVDCNLADGGYRIGEVAYRNNEITFGFEKRTELQGSAFKDFSFRPQRVWAQVSDSKTGKRLFNLFSPEYKPGQYPIAVFKFPKIDGKLTEVDVRLWIAPSINDRSGPIAPYLNVIELGKTTNRGIACQFDKAEGTSTISVERPAGDQRDFFVGGPREKYVHRTTVVDGVRSEKYEYEVSEAKANFTLSALSQEEYRSIMERVRNSSQTYGKDIDPIFGDMDSVWIDFKGVRVK